MNQKINVLISIKPEYAEMIFEGRKKVELRRTCPKIQRGDYLFVYVSSPVKALVGKFRVSRVISKPPKKLWDDVSQHAGISKTVFDSYYLGASIGFGIFLSAPEKLEIPIELNKIRRKWKNFVPPQSYRYIHWEQLKSRLSMPQL